MQIKIVFQSSSPIRLPIHYNSAVQGMIYKNISEELAEFLHDKGFLYEKRPFKLFTFSRLLGEYSIDKITDSITFSNKVSLVISSPVEEFCNQLGNHLLLKDKIQLYNNEVKVEKLELAYEKIMDEKIDVTTLSPITIYSTLKKADGSKYTCYFEPGEKEFEQQLDANLRKKYCILHGKNGPQKPVSLSNVRGIKKNIVRYKNFIIKGYSFKFELTGPKELLQIAVDAGVGSKNSQGFGCIRLN